jgi:hypothetical protein
MDISLIQEKDNLDTYNLLNIDKIEYQKCIKEILEISHIYNLDECTFFHAVDIVKRYINIDSNMEINIICATCIYIASKFNDHNYLEANFSEFCKKEIIKSELYILNKLNFDIYKPNVYTYYCYIQNKLDYDNTFTNKLSLCIIEYFSTDLNIIKFSSCIFAISAIQISHTLVDYKRDIHNELKEITYDIKEIENCISYIKNKFDLLRFFILENKHFRIKYLIILQFIINGQ